MRSHSAVLWFGLLAAPLAWTAQLVSGYGLQEAACPRDDAAPVLGLDPSPLLAAISFVAIVVAGAGVVAALASRPAAGDNDSRGRISFMAEAGLLASFIFLAVIVFGAAALFFFDPCHPG